jgi:hypothetical protein
MWKKWRGKCLSYLLDERTIRIVSGSNFIFSAPKEQWMKVFEPLKANMDSSQSGLVEVMVYILHLAVTHLHYCVLSISIITSIFIRIVFTGDMLAGVGFKAMGPIDTELCLAYI